MVAGQCKNNPSIHFGSNRGFSYDKWFHYRFDPELFQGTLFEVELTRDKENSWSILIGDIYYMSGASMKNTQIHERVNLCNDILENKYIDDSFCNVCPLSIKRFLIILSKSSAIKDLEPGSTIVRNQLKIVRTH